MSKVLFYDPLCQHPYDTGTLHSRALGGTEATLVRVADALGAWVMQHNRTQDSQRYLAPQRLPGISHVIVNRDSRALPFVQQHYPDARVYLWLHDRFNPRGRRARWLAGTAPLLRARGVTVVCVSNWQRGGVEATLRSIGVADAVRALTIYNPVDDALQPDGTAVDPGKLVFFSSPNKGLQFALDAFRQMRRALPQLRFTVANPGYKPLGPLAEPGVAVLGAVPQLRVLAEVRGALCTFAPNFLIPETFGLVFAESHALGTPVLTYDCGAASEIVADSAQLMPVTRAVRCYEAVAGQLPARWRAGPARLAGAAGLFDDCIERIREWRRGGRPRAAPDARFRLSAVREQWLRLLRS
ncbi:MAG TPA: glycosyltransferase family 4 protein [Steroidobacteraceae bacterium]|nr:glycosyltransferase family 4 protein [Steroidobacteraceae bacterium]